MDMSNENHIPQGQHFKIVVNGREKIVTQHELSYVDVVRLAFENPEFNENIVYTVTFKRGPDNKPEGSMVDGVTVKVKPGMIFNVTRTDKS